MTLTPSTPPARARAANDEAASNVDLAPFSIDAPDAERRPKLAGIVLFALGVFAGVLATMAAQSF
jgi:hypothetical protein